MSINATNSFPPTDLGKNDFAHICDILILVFNIECHKEMYVIVFI